MDGAGVAISGHGLNLYTEATSNSNIMEGACVLEDFME